MPDAYHIPAMLKETIEGLNIKPGGVYVDVTFGGGGHSRAILEKLASPYPSPEGKGEKGMLFSFDQDIEAYENAQAQMANGKWQMILGHLCIVIFDI